MGLRSKDPVQKRIEFLALAIWAILCGVTLLMFGKTFAFGVLLGGAVCMANYQWLYRNARSAVSLTANKGSSFMTKRYILRICATGAVLYALIALLHVNIFGLLLGLSVMILGIMSYACYAYICTGGD
jgi:hypothetical protein